MKKKLAIFVVLTLSLLAVFALSVGAATQITDDGTNLVLGECTIAGLDGVTIPSPTSGLVYTLDDETNTAAVSGRGSFAGGDLVFPSSVTYEGTTYALTKINSNLFQSLSYNIYVPDSVTSIAGGDRKGTFGNSTITKAYIGSGLSTFERETFSGSSGFEVFVCKSKPTTIGVYAFNSCSPSSGGMTAMELDLSEVIRFEELAFNGATILNETSITLSPNVEYIGPNAFVSSKANGSIVVPENCVLNYRCFNGTSFEQVVIKVAKGTVRQLPQELFSGASGGMKIIFTGAVEANQNHVFSSNSTSVYMPTYEMIEGLVSTAAEKSGNERMEAVIFYECEELKCYTAKRDGTITYKGEGEHAYTSETIHSLPNCTNYEKEAYVCYACGHEDVVFQGSEYGKHVYETIIKEPTCQSNGYYEYICTVCGYGESAHFISNIKHSATLENYQISRDGYLTITKVCEFCNQAVDTEEISLVNKCYIEGYGLFDATMQYVTVDANGVATPGAAEFNNAVIYFPSYAMVDGNLVEVKTIKGFKAKSIKSIYIPDTVTRIAGGSGAGCFGDISTLKNIVVGKGVTALEQETFCMGGGATLEEFIFKGTITRLETLCLSSVKAKSNDIPYEFNTALTYVGSKVNINGNLIREVVIKKGCDLHEKFAFNDSNSLLTVYIEGGDTPETALDLGQEFTSNTGTKYLYIKGYVTVSGQAVLSGINGTTIYMESTAAIDLFANAIKAQNYSDRINKVVFMDCGEGKAWYVSNSADRVVHPSVAFSHGGKFVTTEATCTQAGSITETCFVCGETVSSEVVEKKEHVFDGGVITSMPTKDSTGEIVYTCLICHESEAKEISAISDAHICDKTLVYENGFGSTGLEIGVCPDCDCIETIEREAIIIVLGYSVDEEKTGIISRYRVNKEALQYYEDILGDIEIGFLVAEATDVEKYGVVNENNKLAEGVRGCQIALNNRNFRHIEVKLLGMTTEASRECNFIFSAYAIANNKISFIQYQKDSSLDVEAGDYVLKATNVNTAYGE
ncbi:MAG: leucine-rich repeat protein [Clostridia bacterium]|nr:leucine-rich repeat protein [Clostridia bacterium]